MARWMLMGIQVAFAKAPHTSTMLAGVSEVTSAGGLIMYVSHELAMSITAVPKTFNKSPNPKWPNLARP